MKKTHAQLFYSLLTVWLIATLALTATACGKADPCPVCGSTELCDCAVVETVTTTPPTEAENTAEQAAKVALEAAAPAVEQPLSANTESPLQPGTTAAPSPATPAAPRDMTIQFGLISPYSDSLASMHFLRPEGMIDWEYTDSMGQKAVLNLCSGRPCELDSTSVIDLASVKNGMITMSLPMTKYLESYTVTAYPIGKYDATSGIAMDTSGEEFRLLDDAMYYEIVVKYTMGTVTYGFFIETEASPVA